jgi:hypothetical protein
MGAKTVGHGPNRSWFRFTKRAHCRENEDILKAQRTVLFITANKTPTRNTYHDFCVNRTILTRTLPTCT